MIPAGSPTLNGGNRGNRDDGLLGGLVGLLGPSAVAPVGIDLLVGLVFGGGVALRVEIHGPKPAVQ